MDISLFTTETVLQMKRLQSTKFIFHFQHKSNNIIDIQA